MKTPFCPKAVTPELLFTAVQQAQKSNQHYRHGSVIFDKRGNIISKGYNIKKEVPELKRYGYRYCFLHAESHALLKADPSDLVGSSLLVLRVNPTKLSSSKPCNACASMISETGIRWVYYSTVDGNITRMKL